MSYNAKEYKQTVVFTLSQAKEAVQAQNAILTHGIRNADKTGLVLGLTGVTAGLLSLCFGLGTVATLSAGIIGTALGLIPDEKTILTKLCNDGLTGLYEVVNVMAGHPNYDQVEVELPMMEFVYNDSSKNWKFIQGKGRITRIHTPSGWMTA